MLSTEEIFRKKSKKFDEIKKKYYQSYSYDPTDIYEELLKYVEEKKIFPLRSCEEGHDLAIQIASKKNRNKFTDEQLANIENLRKKYGRKSGVSSQDQLLYFFLNENLCNLEIKAQKKDDSKIDVFIGNSKYKIAIFYDGYYHKFCEERDNLLNEKLIKKGYLVYRLREENLPELINRDNLYIRIIKSKKLDDLIKCEYTGLLSELSEKYLFEIKKCGKSNNELITLAMQNSTSRINTKKVLNEYVSECLFEEVVIPSKSRLSKNIAKQVHDNNLSENELNLYKMVKEIYSKKGKNQ